MKELHIKKLAACGEIKPEQIPSLFEKEQIASHRLASTRFCDHILFLESGKITEEGTHEELMQKNGGYAEMFLVQSRYYKEEGAQSHDFNTTLGY